MYMKLDQQLQQKWFRMTQQKYNQAKESKVKSVRENHIIRTKDLVRETISLKLFRYFITSDWV